MIISALTVKNFLGITDVRIDCGRITEIKGRNGSSKTSILEALKAAIGGGDLNQLKRVGAESDAEIGLVLDAGAYKVQRKGKDTKVEQRVGDSAAYETVRKPQTFLDSLYDAKLSNPLLFLNAPPNTRADLLLQVLTVELDADKLGDALGGELWPKVAPIVDAGGHPLNVLAAVRASLYEERAGVNRSKEDMSRTAQKLKTQIPAHMPDEVETNLGELEQERDALVKTITDARAAAESEGRRIVTEAQAAFDTAEAQVKADFRTEAGKIRGAADKRASDAAVRTEQEVRKLEQQIAALRDLQAQFEADEKRIADRQVEERRTAAEAQLSEAQAALEGARETADAARQRLLQAVDADQARLTEVSTRIATFRNDADRIAQLRHTKKMADEFEERTAELKGKAEQLSKGIEAVDVFRAEMLNDLPIEGLSVEGKEIKVNGVPFDQINTATRIKLAVHVAELRAKRQTLPVLFIDGAEALDQGQYELLLQEVEATGCQAFVSRVTDGPLEITASEHVAASA